MAYQLKEINHSIRTDPKGFLAQCDARYQDRISAAVNQILARMKQSPIVLLSGPSGSGKTTTAMKLEQELERRGVNTHTISMDNYYSTLNRKTAPRTPEGDIDYESPLLMDLDLLDDTFTRLSRGEWVVVPKYEFARQMRNDSRGTSFLRASTPAMTTLPAATRRPPACTSPPAPTCWRGSSCGSRAPGCGFPAGRCGTIISGAQTFWKPF